MSSGTVRQWFTRCFYPTAPPGETTLAASRRYMPAENALASVIFALGTGNFIAGYMTLMGASPSFCAMVAALPQLGCVMQLLSPFLFERLRHRKLCIVLLCLGFRLSLSLPALIPFLFHSQNTRLEAIFALYFVGFMLAGFVTPGLNNWLLGIAPTVGRGRFYARQDIISSLCNAVITFFMGLQLDYFISIGNPLPGYLIICGMILLLTIANISLLSAIAEIPAGSTQRISARDFLTPFRDKKFRPIILFLSLRYMAANFSASFLSVYLLESLRLSHSFISLMVILASITGISASWLWGRLADRAGWRAVLLAGCGIGAVACFGWFLATPAIALFAAPVLQCLTSAGNAATGTAGLNLQYLTSPAKGRTVYFGVVAAISNLCGFAAAMLASALQPLLVTLIGARSISVLFLASAIGLGLCVLQGRRSLPDTSAAR